MDCKTCKEIREQAHDVPFISVEADKHREEKREKRHCIIHVIMAVLLLAAALLLFWNNQKGMKALEENNQRWIDYLEQYDFCDYEYTQDGQGVNIIGDRNGVDFYGTEIPSENQDTEKP